MCLWGQAEEGTDDVYAQVSLAPESEVSFVHFTRIVWLPIKCRRGIRGLLKFEILSFGI